MNATRTRINPKSPAHRASIVEDLLRDLEDIAEDEFRAQIPHSSADLAQRLLVRMRERWGGVERYIPAGDMAKRDKAIRLLFNGRNLIEVCSEFEVSPATVYRICDRRLRRPLA